MDDDDARLEIAAYKILADSVEKTSDRRQEANNFFITMNLGIAAADAFMAKENHPEILPFSSFLGVLVCILWALTLWYYRSISAAKYKLLGAFETKHNIVGYQKEWEIFSSTSPFGKMGLSLSTFESMIALLALIGHFFAPYILARLT